MPELRIKAESTLRSKGTEEPREGDRQHSSPEKTGCYGPSHPNLSVREREHFCAVGERDWTFAWRIEGSEQEDEESYAAEMGWIMVFQRRITAILRDPEPVELSQ